MKQRLGIFFTCFDELEAARISLNILKKIYPDIRIRLFSESSLNFNFFKKQKQNKVTIINLKKYLLDYFISWIKSQIMQNLFTNILKMFMFLII